MRTDWFRKRLLVARTIGFRDQAPVKTKGATDCSVAPRLVPSPRYFAKLQDYCRAVYFAQFASLPEAALPVAVKRITASSFEQKPRTPV